MREMPHYPVTPFLGFSDPVSSWLHLIGAVVALVLGIRMLKRFDGPRLYRLGLYIFIFGTMFMFSMSGVYHILDQGSVARYVFQHLDHASIWLMIAGTFTPIHLMLFRGWMRWGILALIWTAAINGIVLKTIFFDEFPEWLGLVFYLCLGWIGILSANVLIKRVGVHGIRLVAYGGIAYSIGAIFEFFQPPFFIEGIFGPHEVFHIAVILGVFFHWRFIESATVLALDPDFCRNA